MDKNAGSPEVQKFIAAYEAEYKTAPENAFAGLGYDTVYLLADAIKRANSTDPKKIKEALQTTKDLPGVTGTITFQSGNPIPQKGVAIIEVKNGQLTLAAQVVPQKVPAP
jgi:branched-chain amino acid transport system substrate-binding protein